MNRAGDQHDGRARYAVGTWVLASVLAAATFPLIWIGGLVTTYRAGMAVPDWPTTYGYNLLLYPWSVWIAGPWDLFVEHGHRLFATFVGAITVVLVLWTWVLGQTAAWRIWSVVLLVAVVGQGLLGGLRVLRDDPRLAQIHACVGPAFFAMTLIMVWLTAPRWARGSLREHWPATPRMRKDAWSVAVVALGQLALGSFLRHVTFATGMATLRAAVMLHLLGAAILAWVATAQYLSMRRHLPQARSARWHTGALMACVGLQILLGMATWVVRYGVPYAIAQGEARWVVVAGDMTQTIVATAHVALGALILGLATLWAVRVTWPSASAWVPAAALASWTACSMRTEVVG